MAAGMSPFEVWVAKPWAGVVSTVFLDPVEIWSLRCVSQAVRARVGNLLAAFPGPRALSVAGWLAVSKVVTNPAATAADAGYRARVLATLHDFNCKGLYIPETTVEVLQPLTAPVLCKALEVLAALGVTATWTQPTVVPMALVAQGCLAKVLALIGARQLPGALVVKPAQDHLSSSCLQAMDADLTAALNLGHLQFLTDLTLPTWTLKGDCRLHRALVAHGTGLAHVRFTGLGYSPAYDELVRRGKVPPLASIPKLSPFQLETLLLEDPPQARVAVEQLVGMPFLTSSPLLQKRLPQLVASLVMDRVQVVHVSEGLIGAWVQALDAAFPRGDAWPHLAELTLADITANSTVAKDNAAAALVAFGRHCGPRLRQFSWINSKRSAGGEPLARFLCQHPGLRTLRLHLTGWPEAEWIPVRDVYARHAGNAVECLDVTDSPGVSTILTPAGGWPALRTLRVGGCKSVQSSAACAASFRLALLSRRLETLHTLEVCFGTFTRHCPPTSQGLEAVLDAWQGGYLPHLQTLAVMCSGLRQEALQVSVGQRLVELVQLRPDLWEALRSLHLSSSLFAPRGPASWAAWLQALAAHLRAPHLRELNMDGGEPTCSDVAVQTGIAQVFDAVRSGTHWPALRKMIWPRASWSVVSVQCHQLTPLQASRLVVKTDMM